jgi:hypothetical protein
MPAEWPELEKLDPLPQDFFMGNVEAVAQSLIGVILIVDHGIGYPAGGRIVES